MLESNGVRLEPGASYWFEVNSRSANVRKAELLEVQERGGVSVWCVVRWEHTGRSERIRAERVCMRLFYA